MIIKIAVFCVAVSNCLQYVAIERQRRAFIRVKYDAFIRVKYDIETLEKAITALERKL